MTRRMYSGKKNSDWCLFSTATKEKKKARGRKRTDGWIDRKETVGVVGWWRWSLSCPRPSIYLGNVGKNFRVREKKLKRGQKQYLIRFLYSDYPFTVWVAARR
jgi:hypothetical protein